MSGGSEEPTYRYQNCNTCHVFIHGGYHKMSEFFIYLGMKVFNWFIDSSGGKNKNILKFWTLLVSESP